MAGIAEVGATKGKKPEKEQSEVTIYFGVFFDGTNNHRLQVLIGKKYRKVKKNKDELSAHEREVAKEFTLDIDTDENYKLKKGYAEELTNKKLRLEEEKKKLQEENKKLESQASQYEDVHNAYTQRINEYSQSGGNNSYAIMRDPDSGKALHYQIINEQIQKNSNKINRINEQIKSINEKLKPKKFTVNLLPSIKYDENNDIQTNDFTNIALLEPFYQAKEGIDKNAPEYAYRIYVSGSGTFRDLENSEVTWWHPIQKWKSIKGAGFGQEETGVVQKVLDAFYAIRAKLSLFTNAKSITLKFDVFGFSRGATAARNFVYNLSKADVKKVLNNDQVIEYKVPFLGIYDTVSSVGVKKKIDIKQLRDSFVNTVGGYVDEQIIDLRKKADGTMTIFSKVKGWCLKQIGHQTKDGWEYEIIDHSNDHQNNVKDLGLYATTEQYKVDKVLHICAADEYRENFALVDIESSINSNGVEIFIPGAHADVGGGYNEDCTEIKLEKAPFFFEPFTNKYSLFQGEFLFKPPLPNFEGGKQSCNNCAQESLRDLGWIDNGNGGRKKLIEEKDDLIYFYSGAKKGYSYVGLHLMSEYANKQDSRKMFSLGEDKFKTGNNNLDAYYNALVKLLEGKSGKRIGITETVKSLQECGIDYSKLRNEYLHFSSNYSRIGGTHVNTPNLYEFDDEHEAYTYRRIIYHGEQNGSTNITDERVEDTTFLNDKKYKRINDINEHNSKLQQARLDYALD